MHNTSRRLAWAQAIALIGSVAAIVAVLVVRLHRPFDADTLSIPVGELHSNAAEAQLLLEQATDDHLAPAFVRHHAQQLGHAVERTHDKLAAKPAVASREPMRREALSLAESLQARLDRLVRDPASSTPSNFAALAASLDALDHRIKPGD
ncbi:hypothetical protein [Cognatilysobacter terrigena]|uniref:hypothetical protein n=1 Tax=Cognatilysobacter terrigena TaxID=2488749 RepID=UPI00105D61F7|nr:hypothetical protein [Lysobacter terrigena]